MNLKEKVTERLGKVMDPELHRPLTELGMVRDVTVRGDEVIIGIKLTVTGCPLKDRIEQDINDALADLPEIRKVTVDLDVMSTEEREAIAQRLRPRRESTVTQKDSKVRVLIVGSGKGGVGKSTVTVNIAAALERRGRRVGVLDADVYGFSVPRMIGASASPVVLSDEMILPVEVHGVQVISMGMLVGEDTPVIWRGPMLTKLLDQFMADVVWGELDYLVVDAPPGTGDVAITLAQRLNRGRLVLVTTPQAAASRVAGRVAQMSAKVGQDVLGIVENMSFFRCGSCSVPTPIFGEGGGQELAVATGKPLLGQVPIEAELPSRGDRGEPIVWANPEDEAAQAFLKIAEQIDLDPAWKEPLHQSA